jgi:hypothetical protein
MRCMTYIAKSPADNIEAEHVAIDAPPVHGITVELLVGVAGLGEQLDALGRATVLVTHRPG